MDAQLKKTMQQLQKGDIVLFAPKDRTITWAAGLRTVAGFENNMIRLECGNIKLLARRDEIKILKQ